MLCAIAATGLHQQVDATVGPIMASMGSPPMAPFQMGRTAAGSTPGVQQPAGVMMHAPTKVPSLIMPFVLAASHLMSVVVYEPSLNLFDKLFLVAMMHSLLRP